jgi:hypothetical protein
MVALASIFRPVLGVPYFFIGPTFCWFRCWTSFYFFFAGYFFKVGELSSLYRVAFSLSGLGSLVLLAFLALWPSWSSGSLVVWFSGPLAFWPSGLLVPFVPNDD